MACKTNIDKFNETVAEIFSLLYESFPVRTAIEPERLLGVKIDETKGIDEERSWQAIKLDTNESTTINSQDLEFIEETLMWLYESGYIRYREHNSYFWFADVVFTSKGLELMKVVPSSLNKSESVGDQLNEAISSGLKDTAASIMSGALTQGFNLLKTQI